MDTGHNKLVQVPDELLEKLRDSYKIDWPSHIVSHNFLDMMMKKFQKFPDQRENFKVYSIGGAVEEDATFVAIKYNMDIIFDSLDASFEKIKQTLKLLNYDENLNFVCVKKCFRDLFLKFIEEENFEKREWDLEIPYLILDKNEAKKFEIVVPEGLQIRALTSNDVERINSIWPHAAIVPKNWIPNNIKCNPTVGLYDQNNQLIAWCLFNDRATLNALQVDTNHLRKGYGELMTKALSKRVAEELNYDPIAGILLSNEKSLKLFEKLGFKKFEMLTYVGIKGRKK